MQRIEHLFVVRVWFESGAEPGNELRGSVEHISSGARRYFADLADLQAFVRRTASGPVMRQSEFAESSGNASD